jgi:aryl-alcohol dehydrogenase-like predicted oxidoreductase
VAVTGNAAFFDTAERYGSHLKTALGLGWGETERLTRLLLERAQEEQGHEATTTRSLPIVVHHRQEPAGNNHSNKNKQHRLEPVVATKFTPSPWRTTGQSVIDACEESRQRLGVEQIDLYQIHMPDIVQPFRMFGKQDVKDEIYWDGVAECYHRGLVKNVGVCNYGPTLVTKCHDALAKRGVPLASNQIAFSLIGRHNGA